jgi:hypothetical protein
MPEQAKRPGAETGRGTAGWNGAVARNDSTPPPQEPRNPWALDCKAMDDAELADWRKRVVWTKRCAVHDVPDPKPTIDVCNLMLAAIDAELAWRRKRALTFDGSQRGGFDRKRLDEIKARIPLYELIQEHGIELKRSGQSWRGSCPFHDSKSGTSFVVSEEHFYCFGCGAGGDHVTFVTGYLPQVATFTDAARYLANYADMPEPPKSRQKATVGRGARWRR